jgi:flagellar motor protein MotB
VQQHAQQQQQQQQQQHQSQQTQQAQRQQQVGRSWQQSQQAQQQQRQNQNQQSQRAQQQRSNQQPQRTQEQQHVEQSAWQQHRAQNWQSDHRTWQQRGGYRGYRVPGDRFRGYFGPEHGFRIGGLPFLVVGGYPRFQYNGYWISAVDPWPESWGNDWYDNDDVYVTYVDNGYYMYDRRYPDVGIAISISM